METHSTLAIPAELDPLEEVLRCCADAAPRPWYPREYAREQGIELAALAIDIEHLMLEGLVQPEAAAGDPYPGLVLTEAGLQVLAKPELLTQLRSGQTLATGRGAEVRNALRTAGRGGAGRVLLIANIVLFGLAFLAALRFGVGEDILAGRGSPPAQLIRHFSGSLSADDIIEGQWWRLVTAGFVHIGLLHLIMNMSMLAFGGGLVEALWGRWRFLIIYGLSLWGGSCLGVAAHADPGDLAGASGALCGIFAAAAVWLFFNHRALPRITVAQMRSGLIASAGLMVFISLASEVSGSGHLGGAVFGALAALLLQLQRWGPSPLRWLAPLGLLALPWAGWQIIDRARSIDPRWHTAEQRVYDRHYRPQALELDDAAERLYRIRLLPLLETAPARRDADLIQRQLPEFVTRVSELTALEAALNRAGPYRNPVTEEQRQADLRRTRDLAHRYADGVEILRENRNSPEQNDAEERAFVRQFLRTRIPNVLGEARRVHEAIAQSLRELPARMRDANSVKKAIGSLERTRTDLVQLAQELDALEPSGSPIVKEVRTTASRYASAWAELLQEAERCLRAGSAWTDDDEKQLRGKAEQVERLRQEWSELVEKDSKP